MALVISTIICPPSLDDLGNWGSLDSLGYSLDSQVWEQCGIYGLAGVEEAQTASSMEGGLVSNATLDGSAQGSCSLDGLAVVRGDPAESSGEAGGTLTGGRINDLEIIEDAVSGSSMEGSRIWADTIDESAFTNDAFDHQRIMTCEGLAEHAECDVAFAWKRLGWNWNVASGVESSWVRKDSCQHQWQRVEELA